MKNFDKKKLKLIDSFYLKKAEFTACHCGHENSGEMLDLLGRGGYLDSSISFVNEIFYSGKKGL